ncbi:hypothetical protein L1N85_18575 [Paenibacillus alkaliterrae]|uniref:hypothetical protein n=1 Tax=Paenibacillus alkaliterrae TaxID=320909 RepID=UPI001F3276F5|nr:hypothetical protein [Paenibacillus alkaliterrae]MCF2940409.1 hypothetical protein [Paenibacillus alkaliterrae]
MKDIQDYSLFVPEFQKLVSSHDFVNMNIEEDENGAVIRLQKQDELERMQKRERLLKTLEETSGILKKYPDAAKELHAIASREDEEDREGTQL